MTSQLNVAFERDGRTEQVPMSVIRNCAYDADRNLRRHAHEAELGAWHNAAVPLAAALNSVKGEVITLCQRRGWASLLDESLFVSGIDRATLDAMFSAARESFPDLRRYFRAKARAIGVEQLAWYDIFAPLGASRTILWAAKIHYYYPNLSFYNYPYMFGLLFRCQNFDA